MKRGKFNQKTWLIFYKKKLGVPLGFFLLIFGPEFFVGSLCFEDWT